VISKFRKFYTRRVIKFGKKLARFQTRAVFNTAYFLVIIPYGVFFRLFAKPFKSGWVDSKETPQTLERARQQF